MSDGLSSTNDEWVRTLPALFVLRARQERYGDRLQCRIYGMKGQMAFMPSPYAIVDDGTMGRWNEWMNLSIPFAMWGCAWYPRQESKVTQPYVNRVLGHRMWARQAGFSGTHYEFNNTVPSQPPALSVDLQLFGNCIDVSFVWEEDGWIGRQRAEGRGQRAG